MKKIWLLVLLINIVVLTRISYLNVNNNYNIKDTYVYGFTAPRGRILDINGNILVDNKMVRSLIFNKLNVSNKEVLEITKILSDIIDLKVLDNDYNKRVYYYDLYKDKVDKHVPLDVLKKHEERKIDSKDLYNYKLNSISDSDLDKISGKEAYIYYLLNKGYSYEDKIIKLDITDDEYMKINSLNLKGIRTYLTWERTYPYNDTLRDVFGLVSSYNEGIPLELKNYYFNKGYSLNDRVGINNLEYIYDDYLKGEKAVYILKDGILKKIKDEVKGKDLVISIDIELQLKIEKILEEEMIRAKKEFNTKYYDSSYMVVSDPNSGEIISLIGKKINKDKFIDISYYNALNSFTVGSVIKGASISVGYKYNIVNDKTKVVDGCVRLSGQNPKCSWKSLGTINDIGALRMSSNYFQYLIAIGLTGNKYNSGIKINATSDDFEKYREVFSSYGLGTLTGIDLSKESSGQKGTTISDDLLLNMGIGQYDTYTPLELSSYINTIAVGERRRLSLVKYILNNDGSIYLENNNEVLSKPLIDDYYLNRVREGLLAVNKSGTGYSYTNHKFSSAGKTGTAETIYNGISTVSTSYVMYAPFDNPKYSIVIVSPNIKYKNKISNYKYPINAKVIRRVNDLIYDELLS